MFGDDRARGDNDYWLRMMGDTLGFPEDFYAVLTGPDGHIRLADFCEAASNTIGDLQRGLSSGVSEE